MNVTRDRNIQNYRGIILLSSLVTMISLLFLVKENMDLHVPLTLAANRWVFVVFLVLVFVVQLLFTTATGLSLLARVRSFFHFMDGSGWLNGLLIVLFLVTYLFLILGPSASYFEAFHFRMFLYWFLGLGIAIFLGFWFPKQSIWVNLGVGLLGLAFVYRIALFSQDVSTYPFSLGWSETSRYYYASLFFSKKLYGVYVPPSVLHPTRYMMQAIPFIFSGLPLWVHRLWQVFLWLVFTFWAGFALKRRLSVHGGVVSGLFVGWAFLFLMQGPVYYHLLVPVIMVLYGFDKNKTVRNFVIVMIASIWAGISRLNWYPVPGMIAAVLYFLEIPRQKSSLWKYLATPVLWVGGGFFIALGTQAFYLWVSGNKAEQYASSFTSDLLWYRLLPSATFPMGVLTGALLISLPLLVSMGLVYFRVRKHIDWTRWLGIGSILAVLFVGGLVVSVKIGGGSNLHNLDAYLTILLIVGSYLIFDAFVVDGQANHHVRVVPGWLIAGAFIIPLLFTIGVGGKQVLPDPSATEQVLSELKSLIAQHVDADDEILFISQRQLPMFGYIPNVKMVHEYENVFLMEMVMSGNQEYLDKFYNDIQAHRFAMIIVNPLSLRIKGRESAFSEENNVWRERVSLPLLESYHQLELFKKIGIEVLVPSFP